MPEVREPIRVLVADDHPIVTEGLRRFLVSDGDVDVLACVQRVDALFEWLGQRGQDVHLVVLDVQIPGMQAGDTVARIRGLGPRVVLFTHQRPDDYVARMVAAGAAGYVSKADHITRLLDVVRAVHAGGEVLSDELRAMATEVRGRPPLHHSLTEREHTVFALLAGGQTPKEIGFELGLAASTVYSHVEKVRLKLGASNLADIQRYAERWGLFEER